MTDESDRLEENFTQYPTDELVSILRNRDADEWRPEVFEVVASILASRGVAPAEVAAMGPEGQDVVESAPTVTIASFFSPAEAQASRMALEEAGLEAWVADEAAGTMYGAGVGARLQVHAKDEAVAREVLASPPASAADLPSDIAEPACPACGSRNVAPEARIQRESSSQEEQESPRKWYYVCGDCDNAWPM